MIFLSINCEQTVQAEKTSHLQQNWACATMQEIEIVATTNRSWVTKRKPNLLQRLLRCIQYTQRSPVEPRKTRVLRPSIYTIIRV